MDFLDGPLENFTLTIGSIWILQMTGLKTYLTVLQISFNVGLHERHVVVGHRNRYRHGHYRDESECSGRIGDKAEDPISSLFHPKIGLSSLMFCWISTWKIFTILRQVHS